MPQAVADPTPALFDMEGPLHRLRGLTLLLHDMGDADHEIEPEQCEALVIALQPVHAELCDAWQRARTEVSG